jgi:integrase
MSRVRFHDLRHTHVSLLVTDSTAIKVVSKRLGHAYLAFMMHLPIPDAGRERLRRETFRHARRHRQSVNVAGHAPPTTVNAQAM